MRWIGFALAVCAGGLATYYHGHAREPVDRIGSAELTAPSIVLNLGGGQAMKLVQIPAGTFLMGGEGSGLPDEDDAVPRHEVAIARPFYMAAREVTRRQYLAVTGGDPGVVKGPDRPVDSVSWYDAAAFCRTVSARTGFDVRLPTEAEWEYACRLGLAAPPADAQGAKPFPAGGEGPGGDVEKPNALGLWGMGGGVWEWCSDWYDRRYYANAPRVDPPGPARGEKRVLRGGCWRRSPQPCRPARRACHWPDGGYDSIGFRAVLSPR